MMRTFDRLIEFDERSRAYPVRTLASVAGRQPGDRAWACRARLDQGEYGACAAFAACHELAAEPALVPVVEQDAFSMYFRVQRTDEFPGGEYPGARPRQGGTSILAILKELVRIRACDSYVFGFSLHDYAVGVTHEGPAILGLRWTEGMCEPDREGRIRPTGRSLGGHGILSNEVDWTMGRCWLLQSWGRKHGVDGRVWLPLEDLEKLLAQQGECAFLVGRRVVDMANLPAVRPASWWSRIWRRG